MEKTEQLHPDAVLMNVRLNRAIGWEAEAISLILQNRVLYSVKHSALFSVDSLLH